MFTIAKTLRELRRLGYQRIGLAMPENLNLKSGFAYQGRYLVEKQHYPEMKWLPPLFYPHSEFPDAAPLLKPWLRKHRPEVIICNDVHARDLLTNWGVAIPKDLGLVHLSLGPDTPDWTGMFMDGRQIGAACVDLLLSQIQQNERGVPDTPYEKLLRSHWVK